MKLISLVTIKKSIKVNILIEIILHVKMISKLIEIIHILKDEKELQNKLEETLLGKVLLLIENNAYINGNITHYLYQFF